MSEASDNHLAAVHRLAAVDNATGQQGRESTRLNSAAPAAGTGLPTAVDDPFFNTADAGNYLGIPKATLLTWRARRPGYGPRAVKAGGRLKYRLSELDRWLREHEDSVGEAQCAADVPSSPPGRPERQSPRRRRAAFRTGANGVA